MTERDTDGIEQVAENAVKEWDYTESESQFDLPPQSVSIPCQLRFIEDPKRNVDRFHNALTVHNYTALDSNPTKGIENPHYDGEVCSTDHYNRVRILVFRNNTVRLFPKDEYVPDADELATLLHALTVGFRSPLEHAPIEQTDTNDTTAEKDRGFALPYQCPECGKTYAVDGECRFCVVDLVETPEAPDDQ